MSEMITLIFVAFIAFGISLVMIINYLMHQLLERDRISNRRRRRNNRVIPLETLIRLTRLRQMEEQRYVIDNHAEVMTELKNKIIVINPDNSMSLGTEN